MSELTKRLEGSVCYASTNKEWPNVLLQEAADRIEALEECLREYRRTIDYAIGLFAINGNQCAAEKVSEMALEIDKARALLAEK